MSKKNPLKNEDVVMDEKGNYEIRSNIIEKYVNEVLVLVDDIGRTYFLLKNKLYRGMPLVGKLGKPRKNNEVL